MISVVKNTGMELYDLEPSNNLEVVKLSFTQNPAIGLQSYELWTKPRF